MKTRQLVLAVLAAGALGLVTEARAASITGSLWENYNPSGGAIPSNLPGTSADVTFSVPNGSLYFDSRNADNGYTIGGWLSTGGAPILSGTGQSGNTMDNTFVHLSGMVSVTAGESFTVQQDDGLTLIIGGVTVLSNPGAHSPTSYTGTYTGATGNFAFDLYYAEIDGAPAVLGVNLPFTAGTVPDGGTTVGLLGMGLAGLAGLGRRIRAS
jgi:hypothetical protein